eukprot:SM000067S20326  [mRNA]  locus=s67:344637:347406:- [translate_table: standard]
MIQAIFIIGDGGEVLLEKQCGGPPIERAVCAWFSGLGPPSELSAVVVSPRYYVAHLERGPLSFLATSRAEMPPLLFLRRIADVVTEYLGGLNDDLLRDHYATLYQLLDEMVDAGYPLTTEPNVLKEIVPPPTLMSRVISVVTGSGGSAAAAVALPEAAASMVPWRSAGVRRAANDIQADLHDRLDAVFGRDGALLRCEAVGEVRCTSRLSGVPEVTLAFTQPRLLDDVAFHPCVRFRAWEADRRLSFVPPDGTFKLMTYRVRRLASAPPLYVKPQLRFEAGGDGHLSVIVGSRGTMGRKGAAAAASPDGIVVRVPFAHTAVVAADLSTTHGAANFDPLTKVCTWRLGTLPKEGVPSMAAVLRLAPNAAPPTFPPAIAVEFRVPGASLSGVHIERLHVGGRGASTAPHHPAKSFHSTTACHYEVRL